jgi:hypothetical protein
MGTQQEATRIYRDTVYGTRESGGIRTDNIDEAERWGETGGIGTRYIVLGTDGAGTRGTITIILGDTEEGQSREQIKFLQQKAHNTQNR